MPLSGRFDLAIALGILAASGQLADAAGLDELECLGELALSGTLRPVPGVLPAALAARAAGRALVVPKENAEEASLASGLTVYAVGHLLELAAHFSGQERLRPYEANGLMRVTPPYPDLSEVQGQAAAKRALLVAAAGAHNLLIMYTNTPCLARSWCKVPTKDYLRDTQTDLPWRQNAITRTSNHEFGLSYASLLS